MKKIQFVISILLVAAIGFGCSKSTVTYPEELAGLHKNVIANLFEDSLNMKDVEKRLETMKSDGSWPDVDYKNTQRGGWPTKNHLLYITPLAQAYQTKGNPYYHKKQVSSKIHLALNYWLENDFRNSNWWNGDIGVPKYLLPTLFLMEDELTEEQLTLSMKLLYRAKIGMKGQNKVWLSGNVLMRSLLLQKTDSVMIAAKSIQEELITGKSVGIQTDWSYHQHGSQLQFGNYGLSYMDDMIKWINLLKNTPYQFDEQKVYYLRNYLLHGQQWVTWKNRLDVSACGRQLFVNSQKEKAAHLAMGFLKMKKLDPENETEYTKANDYKNLIGNKHFWHSDFQVQRTPDYYFSVKMCSDRVLGAESCNSENIQGYHMGDGVALLYQNGDEYEDIFPFWNWKKIPGITVHQNKDSLPVLTAWGYHIETDFVGGVSDSKNGIAVLKYDRDGLQANKAWFMLDDKIVCLGNGINSSTGFDVATSVNQCFLKGEVWVEREKGSRLAREMDHNVNPKWVLHNNVGYIFPEKQTVHLEAHVKEGSWNAVAKKYRDETRLADIFTLWIDHGKNPVNQKYAYIMVPNTNKSAMVQMEKQAPFTYLNTPEIQQVESSDKTTAGIIFYKKGTSPIFGGIKVNQPCLVMLKKVTEGIQVSISDPTQKLAEITFSINGKFEVGNSTFKNRSTTVNIQLPQNDDAGKTSSLMLKKL